MASTRQIRDFYELRTGLQGLMDFAMEFAEEAQAFLDRQGIAQARKSYKPRVAAENGNGKIDLVERLRSDVKKHYNKKRGGKKAKSFSSNWQKQGKARLPANAPEADGKHVTIQEAAKILKSSDAAVRIWAQNGHLPKPTWERGHSEAFPSRPIQVLLKDDVIDYAAKRKAEASA